MSQPVESLDLGSLRLAAGEGRRFELPLRIEPFELGGGVYTLDAQGGAARGTVPARLDVSRTTGHGYVLRLRFEATLDGACMRCLEHAAATFGVDAAEVSQPGEGEDLDSPYVRDGVLDLAAWGRDALALTLPRAILCRDDCAGLCAVCGIDLNNAPADHHHDAEPDPRWAKLSELRFDP